MHRAKKYQRMAFLIVAASWLVRPMTRADVVTDWHIKAGEIVVEAKIGSAPALSACGGLLPVTRHQEAVMPVGTTSSGSRLATGRLHCQPPSRRSAREARGSRWYTQLKGCMPDGAVAK